MLKTLIEHVVRSLVEYPAAVQVTQNDREGIAEILVTVGKTDIGRVIGKDGQTIKAIRSLAAAVNEEGIACDVIINDRE